MNIRKSLYIIIVVTLCKTVTLFGVPAGLVHHWNFDEGSDWHDDAFQSVSQSMTAFDSVGSADAVLNNMDESGWISGREFTCMDFDGSNDYLSTGSDLSETLGAACSLLFWVNTTQGGAVMGAEGSIEWWIAANGSAALSVDGSLVVESVEPVNDGKWHHVAITRDTSTGQVNIYIDGRLSIAEAGPTDVKTTAFNNIGRIGSSNYFKGRLDQIYIFDKVIDEITTKQLMDNHAPKSWDTTTHGTNEDAFSTESVLFKTYDAEQDTLEVVSFSQTANGSLSYNGDGTFTYTPDTDFTGKDSFVYVIEDGKGGFSTSKMNLIVLSAPDSDSSKRTTTFRQFQAIKAGGSDISLNGWRIPRATDWDGDGDNDLLIGYNGNVWLYINTGTASSFSFNSGIRVQANGSNIQLSGAVAITLVDMTGDGVEDLVAVDTSRKIRVYRNTSAAGTVPVYASAVFVKQPNNSDFILPDQRFDAGDWDGDSVPDIIMGTRQSEVRFYRNVGFSTDARFDTGEYEVLMTGAYNLYPRLFDISRNGVLDLLRGINWGDVKYWLDSLLYDDLGPSGTLVITDSTGASPDLHALTDGAMVDFGDYNGDGVLDLLVGGHTSDKVYIAFGEAKTVAECIAENEAIYDTYPTNLGTALEANDQELLGIINANSRAIISHMQAATLPEREVMFAQMAAHVGNYSFLQMGSALNTTTYHHVPSIAGQNLLTMHQMLPDSPTHRQNVADAVGLTGLHREIYQNCALHVGDNQNGTQGQLESVRDFNLYEPRIIYPDTMLTLDHYYGDGRGGHVNSFTGAKNTFNFGEGSDADEWASDLDQPIQDVFGVNAHRGDYFTLVMGHEATHSLDGYINARANTDLRRRWGQFLVHAGGPDIIAGSNGWIDWSATQSHFSATGLWDTSSQTWDEAWSAYWSTGPGSAWEDLSFMRGNIDWFFSAPQESLATQGNHRWMHSEGRLVGAIDRWRRGIENSIEPMKANITEVTTFLDFVSAGLNKVVMYDTHGVQDPYPHATYDITRAWLVRNDKGYITKASIEDRVYEFTVNTDGIVTGVATNIITVGDDFLVAYQGIDNIMNVLDNDHRLEGGLLSIGSFTQPAHGTVSDNGDGTLTYIPEDGYIGQDSFTYEAASSAGSAAGTVTVQVLNSINDNIQTHLTLDESDIAGSTIYDDSGEPVFDGTIYGATVYPDGQIEQGLDFDGVNDYVSIPAMNLNTNTLTISAWIRRNDDQVTDACIVFSRAGSTCAGLNFGSNNELEYHWNDSFWSWQSGLFVPDGQWCHVGMVVQPDKTTIYLNGESSTSYGTHVTEAFDGLTAIGKDITRGDRLYKGAVDDVAIWDRSLSETEMLSIYSKGLTGETFSNENPNFESGTLSRSDAKEGIPYIDTIAGSATDPDPEDTVTYRKVQGDLWLSVADDGILSGIPGDSDVGLNEFIIRAEDGHGGYDQATLQITVLNTFNGAKGLDDFAAFAQWWLENDCDYCGGADLSGDGSVGFDDIPVLAENWLLNWIPTAHWTFDDGSGGIAVDSSVNKLHGTLVNMDDTDWVEGYYNTALDFDGVDDYVEITGYKGITGTFARTCSAWIKTTAPLGDIMGWGTEEPGSRWRFTVSDSVLCIRLFDGNILGTAVVDDNQWHHVAVVLEEGADISQAKFYIDGIEDVISSFEACPVNTGDFYDMWIGGSLKFFDGLIDEVKIYDRALSAEELFNQIY